MKTKIFFLVLCLLCLDVCADAQIFVEQGKVSIDLRPGKTITGSVIAHNSTDKDIKVKVYWEDFIYKAPFDGTKEFTPAGTSDYSCSSWVTFSPQELAFPPYGTREVSYVIKAPIDSEGGHYGVLFFESDAMQTQSDKGISVVMRIGSLFFLESENRMRSASIEKVAIQNHSVITEFSNKGDVILIPEGTYYILDESGVAQDRGNIDKIYMPPKAKGKYHFAFNEDLSLGKHTVIMTVDLQEGNVLVKEIDFEKGPSSYKILQIRD